MKNSYKTGLAAEVLCRVALRLKGYCILATRFRSPRGEIDIVAGRGRTVAFVEVKARASAREAVESVSPRQRLRIQRAAADFIAWHPSLSRHFLRFDIMLVAPRRWPQHIADAWREGMS